MILNIIFKLSTTKGALKEAAEKVAEKALKK